MYKFLLLLNPVYVTFFWAIVLHIGKNKESYPKLFLGKFMVVAFILYFSHLVFFLGKYDIYIYLDSIYTWASLLVYPLFYIYVRLLTIDKKFSFRIHGIYLLPPTIIFILTVPGYIIMDQHEAIDYLKNIVSGNKATHGVMLYMKIVYFLSRIVFIVQVIIYLVLNFKLIKENNKLLQNYYSNLEGKSLYWLQVINFCLPITSFSSIIIAILGRESFAGEVNLLIFPSIIFSVMLFALGLFGDKQTSNVVELNGHVGDTTGKEMELKENHKDGYRDETAILNKKLVNLFENEHIYLNRDLKIWDVSSRLGTNRTYISRVINHEHEMNFCSFVNHFRIKHAKNLMMHNSNLTNDEIAEQSGFGSVNSLYRSFQGNENLSLGAYRESLKNKNGIDL